MQACKPGPVPDKSGSYHLSSPDVAIGIYQPTHGAHRNESRAAISARRRHLFGLSTCKVYHAFEITFETGELLPHLFTITLTASIRATYFLWHFLFRLGGPSR
jgi:hypothetical protein